MVFKPIVSAFLNCAPRYMRHNIVRDIALATKIVVLWTGISVYTSIPVKKSHPRVELLEDTNNVQNPSSQTPELRESVE